MLHHPVILVPKLVVLIVIVAVLVALRSVLTPEEFRVAVAVAILGFALFLILFWTVVLRFLKNPDSRLSKMMVLNDKQQPHEGYRAASEEFEGLAGARGKTLSALRPSGVAMIGDKRVPVQTEGDFIHVGTDIEVVSVKGSRVFVRVSEGDSSRTKTGKSS
jgi:membrane-bound serine protease (ClpP class)